MNISAIDNLLDMIIKTMDRINCFVNNASNNNIISTTTTHFKGAVSLLQFMFIIGRVTPCV